MLIQAARRVPISCRTNGQPAALRTLSTPNSPRSQSSWPLYLAVGGCMGLAIWAYIERTEAGREADTRSKKSPLDPQNFLPFKLKKIEPYNHNSSKFTFELPENAPSLLPVASCVLVKASNPEELLDKKGKPIIRPYTPISPSNVPGELIFLIKRYDSGNASRYIHSLKVGDLLSIKGPNPKFEYKANEFEEVVCIGGGSGITPLYQILNYALPLKDNKTKFKLLYANVSEADILLRAEFDAMQRKYPNNFKVLYAVDKAEKGWQGHTGFIDKTLLERNLPSPTLGSKLKIFICGPPGQVAALSGKKDGAKQGELGGILKELGYSTEQVFKF